MDLIALLVYPFRGQYIARISSSLFFSCLDKAIFHVPVSHNIFSSGSTEKHLITWQLVAEDSSNTFQSSSYPEQFSFPGENLVCIPMGHSLPWAQGGYLIL